VYKAGAADFRAAAEVIRVRGHCKNTLQDGAGHVCLVGALMDVLGDGFDVGGVFWSDGLADTEPVLTAVVAEQYPDRIGGEYCDHAYVAFNNHPDTTPDEVIAVLEKTAVRLEEAVT
jgi:hypothetical protein